MTYCLQVVEVLEKQDLLFEFEEWMGNDYFNTVKNKADYMEHTVFVKLQRVKQFGMAYWALTYKIHVFYKINKTQ